MVCPHAAIRSKVVEEEMLESAPDIFSYVKAKGKAFESNEQFTIQVAVEAACNESEYWITASPVNNSFNPTDATFIWEDMNGNEVNEGDYFSVERNPDNNLPVSGYQKQEPYHPIVMHAFIQDKIEFEDLILNLGLRYQAPWQW